MSSVLGSPARRKVYYDNTATLNIFKSRSYIARARGGGGGELPRFPRNGIIPRPNDRYGEAFRFLSSGSAATSRPRKKFALSREQKSL